MKAILILLILVAAAFANKVEVSTCRELVHGANTNPFGRFVLKNDLDCSEYKKTLIPVFRGSLDGKGYTIRNVNIRCSSQYYCGFFGEGEGARVSNLNLENFQVQGEINMGVGGLFGALSFSYLTNVHLGRCRGARNEISNGGFTVGGLAGLVRNSVISKCSVRETLVSGAIAGGVVGAISTFDITYTPPQGTGYKRGPSVPTVIDSKITETYNYGFDSDVDAAIVTATPSGLVTAVLGYASQFVYDPAQHGATQKKEESKTTLGRSDASKKFILPPVNYLGETWAGGIAGLAFGTNLYRVGVFRGTVSANRNGLINDQLSFIRVAAGGVVGAYGRAPNESFFIALLLNGLCPNNACPIGIGINIGPFTLDPLGGGISLGGPQSFDYPASVTAKQVFTETGVTVFGIDGTITGGLFGTVGDVIIPIELSLKKEEESRTILPTVFLKDSYSKTELWVSGTSQSFRPGVGGVIGFETSCFFAINLVNVVSSARLHSFPSPTPVYLDVFGGVSTNCPSKRAEDGNKKNETPDHKEGDNKEDGDKKQTRDPAVNANVYYNLKINENVPGASAHPVSTGLAPYLLNDAIKTFSNFGTLWKVTDKDYKPNYFFKFQKKLPTSCPVESDYKPKEPEYKPKEESHYEDK